MPTSFRVEICRTTPQRVEDCLAGWRAIGTYEAPRSEGNGEDADDVRFEWAYPPDYCVVVWSGEDPVGFTGVFERDGSIEGRPTRLGGLGGLATHPAWRHRGIATAAIRAAVRELSRPSGPDVALFFAHEAHVPWFEHLGWTKATEPPLFRQPPDICVVAEAPTLVLPLRGGPAPRGRIDLCGLPW